MLQQNVMCCLTSIYLPLNLSTLFSQLVCVFVGVDILLLFLQARLVGLSVEHWEEFQTGKSDLSAELVDVRQSGARCIINYMFATDFRTVIRQAAEYEVHIVLSMLPLCRVVASVDDWFVSYE